MQKLSLQSHIKAKGYSSFHNFFEMCLYDFHTQSYHLMMSRFWDIIHGYFGTILRHFHLDPGMGLNLWIFGASCNQNNRGSSGA